MAIAGYISIVVASLFIVTGAIGESIAGNVAASNSLLFWLVVPVLGFLALLHGEKTDTAHKSSR